MRMPHSIKTFKIPLSGPFTTCADMMHKTDLTSTSTVVNHVRLYFQAFAVFRDAKNLDESRRKQLRQLYKKVKAVLKNCDEKLQQIFCGEYY